MCKSRNKCIAMTLAVVMLLVVGAVSAFASQKWPTATGWVNDYAGVFSNLERSDLERIINQIEAEKGVEISVVTVKSTGDLLPKEYAVELFRRWGIGKEGADNGLLVLVALDERRVEVEVGYGLEGILPDGKVGELLDRYFMPEARTGRFGAGALAFVTHLQPVLAGQGETQVGQGSQTSNPLVFGIILFFFVVIGGSLLAIARLSRGSGARCPQCGQRLSIQRTVLREPTEKEDGAQNVTYSCPACAYHRVTQVVLPALVATTALKGGPHIWFGPGGGGRRGGGGGFGGGGFGGFGGGRSGGGGAGRGW